MANKTRKNKGRHTGIAKHQRKGTRLTPPLATLPIGLFEFGRDFLPEHLWIAALVDILGEDAAHVPFYELMDALDDLWTDSKPAFGLISDFGHIPIDLRNEFKTKNRNLIRRAFHDVIGRPLALYPDGPAYWTIDQEELAADGPLDPGVEIGRLRRLVGRLLPSKDKFAGHVRILPLGRVVKHGAISLPGASDLVDILPRYPVQCTEDEKAYAQSAGRTILNMQYEHSGRYSDAKWAKYFWRHNFDLTCCRPVDLPIRGARPVTNSEAPRIIALLSANSDKARGYLQVLTSRVRIDLYNPTRDEILLGLFARCIRLFVLMSEDSNLWARDMSGIMLRCLADSAITFCYLARSGLSEDFDKFRQYGEGQEKLLMLHLQDSHPDRTSLEGRTAEAVGNELGSFAPELIQIELGSWAKQDIRKLATKVGMEHLYRLVYSPGSSDIHGSWPSLKYSNLRYCGEPLHRFHRLPSFSEPPVYISTMVAAQELLQSCIAAGTSALGFPELDPPFEELGVSIDQDTSKTAE